MNNIFPKSDLRPDLGKTAAQCGLLSGQPVHLFVEVSKETMLAGTGTLSDDIVPGETFVCCRLHNHDLPCNEKFIYVAVGAPNTQNPCKILSHTYSLNTSDQVPETLGDFYANGFHP